MTSDLIPTHIYTPLGLDELDWESMRIGLPVPPHAESILLPPPVEEVSEPYSFDEWTDDPFHPIRKPFGVFFEPAGYAAVQAMKKPNTRSYQRLMPRTLGLARTIYQALPEVSVWGRQRPGGSAPWETITAGKWVQGVSKGRSYKYEQKVMSEWDVLRMLVSTESCSLANTDRHGDRFSQVKHIRLDIDMDNTFQFDGQNHLPALQGELALGNEVFSAFNLTAQIFRTGNRGIQVVAGIPWIDRSSAWVLTEMIRTVLRDSRVRDWRAKDFRSSLDGLMRLPLGLHKSSGSLGLFLGADGAILPVEQQGDAFVSAFITRPDDFSTDWATEMRHSLGEAHEIPQITLQEIVSLYPRNPLVRTFLNSCDQFDVWGWEKLNGLVSHTNGVKTDGRNADEVSADFDDELVSHTNERKDKVLSSACSAKLKQIGWGILTKGFEPGKSFHYYVNRMQGVTGENAVGWAIVCHDGDRNKAKNFLDDQAEKILGSPADVAARKSLIAWCIPENDTYERFMAWKNLRAHKSMDVFIVEADAENADRIVAALPALRKNSVCRTKIFTAKSLYVIKKILELMQALSRDSADGLIRVSERSLAALMPENVNQKDVARNLKWITFYPAKARDEQDCLIEALEIVERPRKATEPTIYQLGPGM